MTKQVGRPTRVSTAMSRTVPVPAPSAHWAKGMTPRTPPQLKPQLALGVKGQGGALEDLAAGHGGPQFGAAQAGRVAVVAFGSKDCIIFHSSFFGSVAWSVASRRGGLLQHMQFFSPVFALLIFAVICFILWDTVRFGPYTQKGKESGFMDIAVGDIIRHGKNTPAALRALRCCGWGWISASAAQAAGGRSCCPGPRSKRTSKRS